MLKSFEAAAELVKNTISGEYPQIRRAWIFGSFSDNSQSSESDLDIMVELDDSMGLQFISMIQDLEDAAQTRVDVITVDQARNLEKKYGYVILGKAKPIYERIA